MPDLPKPERPFLMADEEPIPRRWRVVVRGKCEPPLMDAHEVGLYGLGEEVTRHSTFVGWRGVNEKKGVANAFLELFLEKKINVKGKRVGAIRQGNHFWSVICDFQIIGEDD